MIIDQRHRNDNIVKHRWPTVCFLFFSLRTFLKTNKRDDCQWLILLFKALANSVSRATLKSNLNIRVILVGRTNITFALAEVIQTNIQTKKIVFFANPLKILNEHDALH